MVWDYAKYVTDRLLYAMQDEARASGGLGADGGVDWGLGLDELVQAGV